MNRYLHIASAFKVSTIALQWALRDTEAYRYWRYAQMYLKNNGTYEFMTDSFDVAPKKRSRLKLYVISGFWLLVFGTLLMAFLRSHQAQQEREQFAASIPWDEALLSCNKVFNAEPTEDFAACLTMADEGWTDAALRVAWAYSRDGEYQSWQAAYEWLVWLSDHDQYAKLLSHIVLFEIGESEQLKLSGERGIRDMAINNQPAATAYLATMYYLSLNTLERRSNIAWLLNRAYAQSKHWVLPDTIATIYANGYLGESDPDKAKQLLLAATEEDFPFHANNVAWLLATTDHPELADSPLALTLSQKVVADEANANNYIYVDTLAAAYAANGQYKQAAETQRTALSLIRKANESINSPSSDIEQFKTRLTLFEASQPYIEAHSYKTGTSFFEDLKENIEQSLIESLYVELTPPKAAAAQ